MNTTAHLFLISGTSYKTSYIFVLNDSSSVFEQENSSISLKKWGSN